MYIQTRDSTSALHLLLLLLLPRCSLQALTFEYIRERRIENEVERTAELQIGRTGASGAGAGTVEEGGSGVTGGVAVVSVQSIESVKVRPSQRIVSYLSPILFYFKCFVFFYSILFFLFYLF